LASAVAEAVSTATIVSLVVGTWGAVVATVLAVRDILHGRRSLVVDCRTGVPVPIGGLDPTLELIRVRAINEGRRPIEVRSVTFRKADGSEMFPGGAVAGRDSFPALLGDGQSATVHYLKAELDERARGQGTRIAFAVVGDASGNAHLAEYPRDG
jgi:hypothetical protein